MNNLSQEQRDKRLAEIRAMLDARLQADGSAQPGYGPNVIAIRAEIAKLEQQSAE